MVKYQSFTVDTKKWYGLKEFVKSLHDKHKHFVAIVDAAIATEYEYPIFVRGSELDVYIKSSFTQASLIGITWAGYSVWIDFLHSSARGFPPITYIRSKESYEHGYAKINDDSLWGIKQPTCQKWT